MDGFNEKSTEQVQEQQPLGCLRRFSKTIKVIIIGGLIILLMIPMFMIEDLISERGRTQEEATPAWSCCRGGFPFSSLLGFCTAGWTSPTMHGRSHR